MLQKRVFQSRKYYVHASQKIKRFIVLFPSAKDDLQIDTFRSMLYYCFIQNQKDLLGMWLGS